MRVLVRIPCPLVGPPSEVAQGPRLDLTMGYEHSKVVSLLWGVGLGEYFRDIHEGRCLFVP